MTISVHPLTVGPIVGATSDSSIRLWGRGKFCGSDEDDCPKRCFGVARRFDSQDVIVCKMLPHFDFTGVLEFRDLEPRTEYRFAMGYVFFDGEPEELANYVFDWSKASAASATTAPSGAENMTFVFGSCRYLLKMFGRSYHDQRGDKTFRSIREKLMEGKNGGTPIDMMLMLGDQIYADDLNRVLPDRTVEEFFTRYRTVFGQPHISKLMAELPTYMILDDHEISDNWSQDRFEANPRDRDLFAAAVHAYECYQVVHGPAFDVQTMEPPQSFSYQFDHGRASFFVMDTRTERFVDEDPPQMISREQLSTFKKWLVEKGDQWKFVVTSVPFFPETRGSDKWSGFVAQRHQILDFIRIKGIEKVVFLAGDIHCSLTASLRCDEDPTFGIETIISSSLFWPYLQGRNGWVFRKRALSNGAGSEYKVTHQSKAHSQDNFTRVRVTEDSLIVDFFSRKGRHLQTLTFKDGTWT